MQILNEMKTKFTNIGLSDVKKAFEFIVYFKWTTHLLSWVITSAGIMSECAFMVASLWMSVDANVHPYVLQHMSEAQATHYNYLATIAFIVLPEMILVLSIQTTIGHVSTVVYYWHKKESFWPWVWTILFGIPTLLFLILSVVTVLNMVNNNSFVMPMWLQQIRALSAFVYALSSLLYVAIGKKQEKHWLAKKDELYAELQAEKERITAELQAENKRINAQWQAEKERITAELQNHKAVIAQSKKQNEELQKAVIETAESALQAYSQDCINWLYSGIKTTNADEINHYTGHSKRKLTYAMVNGKLQTATRNKELIVVSSLIEWLKENPPAADKKERDTGPILKVVNE